MAQCSRYLLFCTLAALAAFGTPAFGTPASAIELYGGLGYEARGVPGQAETLYAGANVETVPVSLRTDLSFDIHSVQLKRDRYLDFRSVMFEAGTGSFLAGPFDFSMRWQMERFSRSNASVISIIPFVHFDSRYIFYDLGYNFRTFSMDNGNIADPYFSIEEKELTFAVGGRCWPRNNLSLSLAVRNFDAWTAGNFAAIGYEADIDLTLFPYTIQAIIDYRPSGATAFAATPSAVMAKLCTRMKL